MVAIETAAPARSFARELISAWIFIPINLVACLILSYAVRLLYGLQFSVSSTAITGVLLGLLVMLLGPALRNRAWATLFSVSLASLFYFGNAIKVTMLRVPISTADIDSLPVLFRTMSGLHLVTGITLILLACAMLARMFRYQFRTVPSLILAVTYIASLPFLSNGLVKIGGARAGVEQPADVAKQTQSTDQATGLIALLQNRGPVLYLANDWLMLREENAPPTKEQIDSLALQPWHPATRSPTRNVHVVLLESVWDTTLLARYSTDRNPLDPRFLALWNAAGSPYALSPVQGGATANSEFEVLCGFPAPRVEVAFVNKLKNDMPCLPAALDSKGYTTVASHAHDADNWNRKHAYKVIGFQKYRPIDAFHLDDLDGNYLSDGSFFKQNLEHLSTLPKGTPIFNYQVSLSSHWAYGRNREIRPDIVKVTPDNVTMLNDYVNSVAYTTSAFMDWTEAVLANDPTAIIVAFGDHSPVLTGSAPGLDVFEGVNSSDPGDFDSNETRSMLGLSRTPLLVINGEDGPVRTGNDIPLYEVPHLISQLLDGEELLPQSAQRSAVTVRPFLGHLFASGAGGWKNCTTGSTQANAPVCIQAQKQFHKMRMLRQDSSLGGGYFVQAMHATPLVAAANKSEMRIEQTFPRCSFRVENWGPQFGTLHQGFNVQSDGSSALWIKMSELRGNPQVRIGGVLGKSTAGTNLLTASFSDTKLTASTSPLPTTLQCEGQKPVLIGYVTLTRDGQAPPAPVTPTPHQVLPPPAQPSPAAAHAAELDSPPCAFTIDQWGPQRGTVGKGFNPQPDGSNASWISMKALQGQPIVRVNNIPGQSLFGANLITTSFADKALQEKPATLEVTIQCPGQQVIKVGAIEMAAAL